MTVRRLIRSMVNGYCANDMQNGSIVPLFPDTLSHSSHGQTTLLNNDISPSVHPTISIEILHMHQSLDICET